MIAGFFALTAAVLQIGMLVVCVIALWRLMQAHESIARSLHDIANK
jgi:hypothetical protein